MNKNPTPHADEVEYIPSSPVKRTMAWIALVYVLIFLALTTYFYFTGTMLGNLAPLLTVPGLLGLAAVILVSWRTTGKPGTAKLTIRAEQTAPVTIDFTIA